MSHVNVTFSKGFDRSREPAGVRRSDLDPVCKVMQIDAFNRSIRAISMLADFWSYGSNLGRFGVVFLLGRCAARTVGERFHAST